MIVPDTPTDDSETMTVVMKSIEHNAGLVDSMENDKTKDSKKIPLYHFVPQNKRFKPTLTTQNSKPVSAISQSKKPN
jgi:hypothetical protein